MEFDVEMVNGDIYSSLMVVFLWTSNPSSQVGKEFLSDKTQPLF